MGTSRSTDRYSLSGRRDVTTNGARTYLFSFQAADGLLQIIALLVRNERMGMRIVVHEYAPEHEPDDGNAAEEVKHVRPAAGYKLYDEPADEVRDNVTDLHTCKTYTSSGYCDPALVRINETTRVTLPANTTVESFPFSSGGAHWARSVQSAGNVVPCGRNMIRTRNTKKTPRPVSLLRVLRRTARRSGAWGPCTRRTASAA